jgi:hypothetical protein
MITLSSTSLTGQSKEPIAGTQFVVGEKVFLYLITDTKKLTSLGVVKAKTGSFTTTVTIAGIPAGTHTIVASGSRGSSASVNFELLPSFVVKGSSVAPGGHRDIDVGCIPLEVDADVLPDPEHCGRRLPVAPPDDRRGAGDHAVAGGHRFHGSRRRDRNGHNHHPRRNGIAQVHDRSALPVRYQGLRQGARQVVAPVDFDGPRP